MAWFVVRLAQFEWLAQQPSIFRSSPPVRREFCSRCGTQLTYQHDDSPHIIELTTATLDDASAFPPTQEIWLSQKLAWAASDARVEHYFGESQRSTDTDGA